MEVLSLKPPTPTGKPHPRTKFTAEEDAKIEKLVAKYGENDWAKVAAKMKGRNVRQCRERWRNYLSPDLDKSTWKEEEDNLLIEKYKELGPRWKTISSLFPNRTDIAVKNRLHRIVRGIEKKNKKALKAKSGNTEARTVTEDKPIKEVEEKDPIIEKNESAELPKLQEENSSNIFDPQLNEGFDSYDAMEFIDDRFDADFELGSRFDDIGFSI